MKNNQNGAGRKVVVSDIEFCPIDPLEFSFQQMPKCYGQMIVDTEAKTITFKRTGGSAPGIYQVLVAMFINKHWTRIMKDPANKKDILTGFLLFSSNGNICYAAHKGENDLPVIDKKLAEVVCGTYSSLSTTYQPALLSLSSILTRAFSSGSITIPPFETYYILLIIAYFNKKDNRYQLNKYNFFKLPPIWEVMIINSVLYSCTIKRAVICIYALFLLLKC